MLDDFPRYHPRATARCRSGFTDISRYGLVHHFTRQGISLRGAFAQLGTVEPEVPIHLSACRHADRTISSPECLGAWRMASEDSDQLGSGFLAIHRLDHLKKICQAVMSEVISTCNPLHAEGELLEVEALSCPQRVLPEERDYDPKQVGTPADAERQKVLAVIVMSEIPIHRANTKKRSQSCRHSSLRAPCVTTKSCVNCMPVL